MISVIKVLVSQRTAEQAKWAPTLKGRRLWCHHRHWFGHWGGGEGILGGCAEGTGDLWTQGADTLCFAFYLWHCKTNRRRLQTETQNKSGTEQCHTRWHFTLPLLFVEEKDSTVRWGYKSSFKKLTTYSLAFCMRRYRMITIPVLSLPPSLANPQIPVFPLLCDTVENTLFFFCAKTFSQWDFSRRHIQPVCLPTRSQAGDVS